MQLLLVDRGLEISNEVQKISFLRDTHGARAEAVLWLSTSVRRGDRWEVVFGSRQPLLSGPDFDLLPTAYEVVENSSRRIAVLLTGIHTKPDYTWDLLVEALEGSPWFRLRITCHLNSDLIISAPEPTAALWLDKADDMLAVDQGPVSIYGGHSWGNSFPAAYLWEANKESIIFFNITLMDWMSSSNLRRFLDCRVATRFHGERAGLGLHALSQSGNTIPAGHLVVEYFLLSKPSEGKPTTLEALNTTVQACAVLLPAAVPFPENRVPPYELTWKCFTDNTIKDLMRENISYADLPSTWTDGPVFPENSVPVFRPHSDYATNSSGTSLKRTDVLQVWDYATCNNFLAPWIAYLRLHPEPDQERFLAVKRDNVPQFYDARAKLYRWGAGGVPLTPGLASTMANGIEMSWENFMFNLETIKIHNALPPDQFNVAIPGRFLMACEGLVEYAHKVDYVFPQWFDAFEKTPMVQLDVPELGKVKEPFQAGSYAYIMLEAYALTGETIWFDEARKAVEYLLTDMQYTEVNRRYVKTFTDPVEMPIAETFGNGYAVAAAQRLYLLTGEEKFLQYAKDYLNILVRMAFWYDDRSDALSRELNNLGLFRAHGGHYGTCPWENIEVYLPLTVFLKHTSSHNELLLKLFNLQRINSFYYYPPSWTPLVAAPNPELYHHVCQYLPIENFYTLEFGGTHGSMGRCIYMCSQAIWNYLLYEAFAETTDREVMVLNLDLLDGYEDAIESIDRSFLVYNPTGRMIKFTLMMKSCIDGSYETTISGPGGTQRETYAADVLRRGLPLSLGALQALRIHIEHQDAPTRKHRVAAIKQAQARMAHAYQLLQQAATNGMTLELQALKDQYLLARNFYDAQRYADAAAAAQNVIDSLRHRH